MLRPDEAAACFGVLAGRPAAGNELEEACRAPDLAGFGRRLLSARRVADGGPDNAFADDALLSVLAALDRERQGRRRAHHRLERAEARLVAGMAKAASLRDDLRAVESSATWRMALRIQRAASLVPPPLLRALRRALRLFWWTATLQLGARLRDRRAARRSPLASTRLGATDTAIPMAAAPRLRALVIDNRWPQPDRDAGSVEAVNLVDALAALGFDVTYAANEEHALGGADRDALRARGVRCVGAEDAPSVLEILRREGRDYSLCVLARVFGGGTFLEAVEEHCPFAGIVFSTIDLHFVRIEREARLAGDAAKLSVAAVIRAREEFLTRRADATIVVSAWERELLSGLAPEALVVEMPLARPLSPPRAPFEAREGVGFIGGFAHGPNRDALRWFLSEIWPLVLHRRPDCPLSIVGADLPPEELRGVPGRVRYLGHLPDIGPWFESLRLSVAPLRYGAGAKGKVASSLAAGVPCIGTAVAAEGMALRDGENILLAETPEDFAARLLDTYEDPEMWAHLSFGSQVYAAAHLSTQSWRARLAELLRTIGALPERTA